MTGDALELASGINRVLTYLGYVLLAGTFTFWSLVWPQGRAHRRLVVLSVTGTGLSILATLIGPGLLLLGGGRPGDLVTPLTGAVLLVRLAALVAVAFWLVDVVRAPIVGWRRGFAIAVVAVIAATLVVSSEVRGGPWPVIEIIATSGHVLATATWLGGLVALAAVLIPRDDFSELDRLIPRFSLVATLSIIVLVVTGTMKALTVTGGVAPPASSPYGSVLIIKIAVFAVVVVLGYQRRRYAARVAFRQRHLPAETARNSQGAHRLAVMMGVELAMAFAILAATSVLVAVRPHP